MKKERERERLLKWKGKRVVERCQGWSSSNRVKKTQKFQLCPSPPQNLIVTYPTNQTTPREHQRHDGGRGQQHGRHMILCLLYLQIFTSEKEKEKKKNGIDHWQ